MRIKPWHIAVAALVGIVIVFVVLYQVPIRVPRYATKIETEKVLPASGQFGDMFGVANALFSGLAFTGLIATLLLQMEELQISRKAASEQLELAAKTARLSALPSLIDHTCSELFMTHGGNLVGYDDAALRKASVERLEGELIARCLVPALNRFEINKDAENAVYQREIIADVQRLVRYKRDMKQLYEALRSPDEVITSRYAA